ncbi:MAG TPA: aldose epimerase family protein [Verrucomicrobiae bacterium]|nr:aldose epimerase family protein [Verrucomicrobiae bacterium]
MLKLEESVFGKMPDGTPVKIYQLSNARGVTVKFCEYGLIITEIWTPDAAGKSGNIVLGFDNLERYLQGHPFFGAIAGRVANRIAKGKFTLDGKEYTLATNNGVNHLHGGRKGFDKKVWSSKSLGANDSEASVEFSLLSPDGDEGYPGSLSIKVTYTLTANSELRIDYRATTDQATIINVTNHSYFNLAGSGEVLGHEAWLAADHYTPVDEGLIPTGEIRSVKGTPLDFTTPTAIGARYAQTGLKAGGYDHNFVLNSGGKSLALAGRVFEPNSRRVIEVSTTEPGMQLYTAVNLHGPITGTGGVVYQPNHAFCLETQHFPDSINHANFPSVVLRPGQEFASTTVYKFSTR